MQPPVIRSRVARDGRVGVELYGRWDLQGTRHRPEDLLAELVRTGEDGAHWDLTHVEDLDVAGATLLWRAWGGRRPAKLTLRPEDEEILVQFAALRARSPSAAPAYKALWALSRLGLAAQRLGIHAAGMLVLLGEIALGAARLTRNPAQIPWREISAVVYRSGLTALPITALLGFLIGIVLSYLAGQQLLDLGAGALIVNLMGYASLRELGPLLASIVNAGRSGSSMTAQIGVMRITSELEAMSVLGISPTIRLVLPKVLGQVIALPLVVLWTDALALLGGMVGAKLQLQISYQAFWHLLPEVVPLADLWFGVIKGAIFGGLVALVACYFGLLIRPDTRSLAAGTTRSVVTALTVVLLADALFAMVFSQLGS